MADLGTAGGKIQLLKFFARSHKAAKIIKAPLCETISPPCAPALLCVQRSIALHEPTPFFSRGAAGTQRLNLGLFGD
jgi:hypothetical protein